MQIYRLFSRLHAEDEATTAVEYAVLLMLIAGSIIAALQFVGSGTGGLFSDSRDSINNAFNPGSGP